MSIVRTVGSGMAWNTGAIFLGKIIMFANVFIILRWLTVYEYGFSELVLSIVSTASIALLPGLASAIIADMSVERGRDNRKHMNLIFHQYLYFNAVLSTLAWAVLFFGAHPVASLAGTPYAAQFLQIVSFTFLIGPFRTVSMLLASVMLRFADQSLYVVAEEAFKLVFLIVFVVMFSMGVRGLFIAIVLSQLACVLAYTLRTLSAYRYFSDAPAEDRAQFWNLLRAHRKWSIGTSYISTLSQNIRLWIIKFMLGTEAVGLFSFALGMYSQVTSLMPLTTVLTPIIPHYVDKRDQLVRIIRASLKLQFAIGIVYAVIAVALSGPFVSLFFPNYLPALPVLYAVEVGIIINGAGTLFTPIFAAFKEQRSLLFSIVFKTLLMLIFLPPCIFLFGLAGPGIEVVLSTLGNGIERYSRLRKIIPGLALDWRTIFKPDAHERAAMRTIIAAVRARWG
jgi:O-antigen/teichoic acid export membrane protein